MTAAAGAVSAPLRVALIGSPNAGKTTLFNGLTGSRAKVANFAGVTVTRRQGTLVRGSRPVQILDLPGLYSLDPETPDEAIVGRVLEGRQAGEPTPDALLIVVDGTTLGRGLGLVSQVLAQGVPTALVVTMIDEVRARGGRLDLGRLESILGIPVLGVVGHRGIGLDAVRDLVQRPETWPRPAVLPPAQDPIARFDWVDAVTERVGGRLERRDSRTERLDRILLHPVGGICIFAAVMVLLFQSIFSWALPLMNGISATFTALGQFSRAVLPPGLLTDLWTDGLLAGVGSVLVFVPQIAILFALIHLLEDVGYMARAAFVVDRIMGWIGLQGRCFVALLSSYACAVPGIMATRGIRSQRDRLATILVAPFMTCSARLPVYAVLIAAFIPARSVVGPLGLRALVLLGLYAAGTLTAFVAAWALGSTLLRGTPSSFYMELPPYRIPTLRLLATQVWGSVRAFLRRAGTIILAASLVLWALLAFPHRDPDPDVPPEIAAQAQLEGSAAAALGRTLEPVIAPLGFDWRIGVGLIASLAAREVIVATLAQIYAVGDAGNFEGLRAALRADPSMGLPTALALLAFFVFALQCSSTIVTMARETGSWRWPAFAFTSMLAMAWVASFTTYRVASALVS
ncbi:MAG: ferrous iron transporter B [Myxococcota bacterium]